MDIGEKAGIDGKASMLEKTCVGNKARVPDKPGIYGKVETGDKASTEEKASTEARYRQAVEKILAIPRFTEKNPLAHTRELLAELGNPQERFQVIHVAGSNGKGSVCAYLASVLVAAGKRTALFTSPHLVCIEERFCMGGGEARLSKDKAGTRLSEGGGEAWLSKDKAGARLSEGGGEAWLSKDKAGTRLSKDRAEARQESACCSGCRERLRPCSRQEFVEASAEVDKAAAALARRGLPHPTFFEYIFAMGMLVFAWNQVEYAVLETGLGGRLDATNVVRRPLLTVLTSISLEHTEILGDTVAQIAAEKAGILKPGVPVVYDASAPEANEVVAARADALGCPSYPVDPKKIKIFLNTGKKIDFSYDSGYDVMKVEIPFCAPYQAQNAAVALQALECLPEEAGISREAVRMGMAQAEWRGRMQEVRPGIYLDGAHNNAGIEKFLEAVGQITGHSAVLLFSMVREKDYAHAAKRLLESGRWEEIIVTSVPGVRGVPSEVLAQAFCNAARTASGVTVKITEIEEPEDAFAYAQKVKKPGQALFCAGSLYLIGELERIAGGMQK